MIQTAAIRVDASPTIGIGHVMRCLTLADGLAGRGVRTGFISRHLPHHLREVVRQHGHEVTMLPTAEGVTLEGAPYAEWLGTTPDADAHDTLQALTGGAWDLVVVDHYALEARWERAIRAAARQIMVIDDLADRPHDCDLLVDQNLYGRAESRYAGKVPETCRLMLGPRFALLREGFSKMRAEVGPRTGAVGRLLVCFGGVDADNHTMKTIDALSTVEWRGAVDVVIGAAHPHRREIEAACVARAFTCHVQSSRMSALMGAADLSIGAGGSTTWERCCVGLPSMVVVMADNQRRLVRDSAAAGVLYAPDVPDSGLSAPFIARHLQALLDNSPLREAMSRTALATVDGQGVRRVLQGLGLGSVTVRPARADDSKRLFDWRNAPAIRAVSRHTSAISWLEHDRWFTSSLDNPHRHILIGASREDPIGVVRFDIEGTDGEVSIYLSPQPHPPGTGSALLESAERWLVVRRPDVERLVATVVADNLPSHRLFAAAGYTVTTTSYTKRVQRNG